MTTATDPVVILATSGDEYDLAVAHLLGAVAENRDDLGPYGDDVTRAAQKVRDLARRRAA